MITQSPPRQVFFEQVEYEKNVFLLRSELHFTAIEDQLNHKRSGLVNAYALEKTENEFNLMNQISKIGEESQSLSDIQVITLILKQINLYSTELRLKIMKNDAINMSRRDALADVLSSVSSYVWQWTEELGRGSDGN